MTQEQTPRRSAGTHPTAPERPSVRKGAGDGRPAARTSASSGGASGVPSGKAETKASVPAGVAVKDGVVIEKSKGIGKGKTIAIAVVAVVVAAAIGLAIFFASGASSFFDSNALSGQAPYKTQEEIVAELNRQVEEGMLNISIASTINFDDGQSEGTAYIENVPNNHYVMKCTITRNDTGDVLYESGGIKPGSYIEKIKLSQDLDPGVYDATATFTAYDSDSLEEVGQAAAIVSLNVKG